MSVVFQLGKATITKDIVFGWMVGRDGHIYARVTQNKGDFIKAFKVTGGNTEFYAGSILEAAFGIMKAWW